MMLKWIETTGRSEEDAIAAALFQLGLDRDDVSVEVLERAKSGFLGFGGNPAKVRVSYEVSGEEEETPAVYQEQPKVAEAPPVEKPQPKEEQQAAPQGKRQPEEEKPAFAQAESPIRPEKEGEALQPAEEGDETVCRIREFLVGLMSHMQVDATPEIFVTDQGNYKVVLQGTGLGAIIGRRGETLDAIQQLTNYSVNRGQQKRVRIHIDAENYRAKREETLQRLAIKVAGKVVKYRKNVTLEAMNAYERHVIHATLQDYKGVSTYSTGVDPNRRTVVAYDPNKR